MKKELLADFYYPGDYFDFSGSGSVSETTINIWIQQMFDKVSEAAKNEPERNNFSHAMSTGNTKVIIEAYRQGSGKFTVYVSVATSYTQRSILDVDLF